VKLPVFQSLAGYDCWWLRGDLIAGLTVWAVLVPEALADASIAGVSPVIGLYAAPPDEVLAFTGVLAIMTGVLAFGAGLIRLGFLANFISERVQVRPTIDEAIAAILVPA
jgi:sulfate permease, SulP family